MATYEFTNNCEKEKTMNTELQEEEKQEGAIAEAPPAKTLTKKVKKAAPKRSEEAVLKSYLKEEKKKNAELEKVVEIKTKAFELLFAKSNNQAGEVSGMRIELEVTGNMNRTLYRVIERLLDK